jgi:hypothetical protein
MRWKLIVVPALAILFLAAAVPARAQVTHAGTEGKFPLTVGFGVSNYSIDWGPGRRMTGITGSVDWRLRGLRSPLNGLSISAEGQWIPWHIPSGIGNHELEAILGGPSYHFQRWDRVQPYAKYFIGFGGVYFTTQDPYYNHDTRVIYAPGGGADVRLWNNLAVRVDYEYQFWPNLLGNTSNPNGFTVGGVWDFGGRGVAR